MIKKVVINLIRSGILILVLSLFAAINPPDAKALIVKEIYGLPDFGTVGADEYRADTKVPSIFFLPEPQSYIYSVVGLADQVQFGLSGAFLIIKLSRICLYDPCAGDADHGFHVNYAWCNWNHSSCAFPGASDPVTIGPNTTYQLRILKTSQNLWFTYLCLLPAGGQCYSLNTVGINLGVTKMRYGIGGVVVVEKTLTVPPFGQHPINNVQYQKPKKNLWLNKCWDITWIEFPNGIVHPCPSTTPNSWIVEDPIP